MKFNRWFLEGTKLQKSDTTRGKSVWRCDVCNLFFSMKTYEKKGIIDKGICPHCLNRY